MSAPDIDVLMTECPWCAVSIAVAPNEINCTIFRCGVYKADGQPVPPHMSKEQCLELVEKNEILGCGQPFKFNGNVTEKCDWI
jgi:hypothetical protein